MVVVRPPEDQKAPKNLLTVAVFHVDNLFPALDAATGAGGIILSM